MREVQLIRSEPLDGGGRVLVGEGPINGGVDAMHEVGLFFTFWDYGWDCNWDLFAH